MDGCVAAIGCISLKGGVQPSTTTDLANLNRFYDVTLWSRWELYQKYVRASKLTVSKPGLMGSGAVPRTL
jgi:hypothetical protein